MCMLLQSRYCTHFTATAGMVDFAVACPDGKHSCSFDLTADPAATECKREL